MAFLYLFLDLILVGIFAFLFSAITSYFGFSEKISDQILYVFFFLLFIYCICFGYIKEGSVWQNFSLMVLPVTLFKAFGSACKVLLILLGIGAVFVLIASAIMVAVEFGRAFIRSKENGTTLYDEFGAILEKQEDPLPKELRNEIDEETSKEVKHEDTKKIKEDNKSKTKTTKKETTKVKTESRPEKVEESVSYYRIVSSGRLGKKENGEYFLASGQKWVKDNKGQLKALLKKQRGDNGTLVNRVEREKAEKELKKKKNIQKKK